MRATVIATLVLATGVVWPTYAAEICGVRAETFSDGFEAGAQVPYDPPSESTPLTMTIDAGIDGSTVASARVRISGRYGGPANTGIVVGGITAARTLGRWSASVPLAAGANTIELKASTIAGSPLTRTVRVTRSTSAAAFTADVESQRFAPARARLALAVASDVTTTRVRVDFDGDGSVDADAAAAFDEVAFAYERPGAYTAVIDLDGRRAGVPVTQRIQVPLVIEHAADTRYALCGAFGEMRARLAARDVEGATRALLPRLRADFRAFWTSASASLPTVAANLGTIADGTIGSDGSAELLVTQPDPARPGEFLGFRIALDRDADGVWRISGM